MNRLEIPDTLYRSIFDGEVEHGITKLGLWVSDARNRAAEIMQSCYIARSSAIQCEFEADYADYIEDMSLGGETYKEPR